MRCSYVGASLARGQGDGIALYGFPEPFDALDGHRANGEVMGYGEEQGGGVLVTAEAPLFFRAYDLVRHGNTVIGVREFCWGHRGDGIATPKGGGGLGRG